MIRFPDIPADFTPAQRAFVKQLLQTLQSQFAQRSAITTVPFSKIPETKTRGSVQQIFVPDDPDGPAIYVSTPAGWRRAILVV